MRFSNRAYFTFGILAAGTIVGASPELLGQSVTTNPFRPIYGWGELPEGREWGSTSAVEIALDGNIWVAERCGANTCVGSDVDPVLLFDKEGNLIRSFGASPRAGPSSGLRTSMPASSRGCFAPSCFAFSWARA